MPQIQIATLAVDLSQSGVVPTEVILLPPGPFSAIDGRRACNAFCGHLSEKGRNPVSEFDAEPIQC